MAEKSKREIVREQVLSELPKNGRGAEVGVWQGHFSEKIHAITQPRELFLIDPWMAQPEFKGTGFGNSSVEYMDDMFESVRNNFANRPEVRVIRGKSHDVLEKLENHSLDWVYLDGNHHEPFIGQDIEICLRKVKMNGIITGDDYYWKAEELGAPVKRAVQSLIGLLGDKAELKLYGGQWRVDLKRA